MPTGVYERATKPLHQRLMAKVTKTDTCWLWTGGRGEFGHGKIMLHSQPKTKIGAHRAAWLCFVGAIPDGLCVLHKCDIPNCVNPSHLFLGSKADNSKDMTNKNRQKKGSQLPHAKLKEDDIVKIRSSTELVGVIAKKFGVSQPLVSLIRSKKIWRHVS